MIPHPMQRILTRLNPSPKPSEQRQNERVVHHSEELGCDDLVQVPELGEG